MRPCVFDTCMCRARHRRHGISFHEFPTVSEIRNKWVAVVRSDKRDPQWGPEPQSRVCSLHFSRSQFLSKKVLHARAVPTARYEAPKFLRPYRRPVELPEAQETIDLADDIPSDLDYPIRIPGPRPEEAGQELVGEAAGGHEAPAEGEATAAPAAE